MTSELLSKYGLKYEDLNSAEKETLNTWLGTLATQNLTIENVKEYLLGLIAGTEKELSEIKETTSFWTFLFGWKRDFYLKARLKNYLTLYDFLTSPDKAKKHIEQSLKNIK